ncbi:MAG TPA: tetratricopeptide repeat protein [Oscillatoriaceae cyanobacterium]
MGVESSIGKDFANWVQTRVSQGAKGAADQAVREGAIAPDAALFSAAARDAKVTPALFAHPELADPSLLTPEGPLAQAGKSVFDEKHAVGGTELVDQLPSVGAKQAKVGEYGVFDNNLSRTGQVMRMRAQRVGPKLKDVGFVAQTSDPIDKATIREVDAQGRVPYQKLAGVDNSNPKSLENFVKNDLYGATGGATTGPHDLILADHGGAAWGWGQNAKGEMMTWPATIKAIADGLPAGQKLRSLILDMCMTGGSSEAAVEAADKGVADTMIGSEDITYAEGIHQDALLKALQANPTMSGKDVLDTIMKSSKPRSVDTHNHTLTGVSLDPAKMGAYTDAFKNLSDVLQSKGANDPAFRAKLRAAFTKARPFYNEKSDDFQNRDVKELMQLIRGTVKDPQVTAATRRVDTAHDAVILTHAENVKEGGVARGLSVSAPAKPMADGHMHLKDGGFTGNDYTQTAFDQKTGWSNVLGLVNRDHLLYDQASAIADKQPQQAVPLLRDAVQENPSNLAAKVLLGRTLLRDPKSFDEGIQTLEQAAKTYAAGDLRAVTLHRDMGMAYLAKGDKANAKAQLTLFANGLNAYQQGAQQWMTYAKYTQMQTWVQQQYGPALDALKTLQG